MRWRDALGLALRAVSRRFGRASLTLLAVALATALLTALVVIATTAKTRVIGQLTKGGPLASIRVQGSNLDQDSLRLIQRLPSVKAVAPVVVARELVAAPVPATYRPGTRTTTTSEDFLESVVGIDTSQPDRFPFSVLAGRLPRASSLTEVAVTQSYLERVGLSRDDPVPVLGTELELAAPRFLGDTFDQGVWGRWTRATIVGVVAQEAAEGDIVAPTALVREAQRFTEGGSTLGGRFDDPPFAAFLVEATDLSQVGPLADRLEALGYSTSAPENLIATVERYLHVVEIVLSAIGLIALLISALGISNALLAAIRERRREIGVLKAIGARDSDVLRVFLIEAGLLGFVGGVLGAAAGWVIARTVAAVVNAYLTKQGLFGVKLVAPPAILLGAVAGATVLALLAGALPAARASRLPAREAMGAA
jgi:ABC-type antimicrobial peptide transport system permease subunit